MHTHLPPNMSADPKPLGNVSPGKSRFAGLKEALGYKSVTTSDPMTGFRSTIQSLEASVIKERDDRESRAKTLTEQTPPPVMPKAAAPTPASSAEQARARDLERSARQAIAAENAAGAKVKAEEDAQRVATERQAEIRASWDRVVANVNARNGFAPEPAATDEPDPYGWQAIHRDIGKRRCTDAGWARAVAKVNAANGFPAADDIEEDNRSDPHGWRAIHAKIAERRNPSMSSGKATGSDAKDDPHGWQTIHQDIDERSARAGWARAVARVNAGNGFKV